MYLRRSAAALLSVLGLAALVLWSGGAMEGARRGLDTCARVLIPSLFPFFIMSALLRHTGAVYALARAASPVMPRLFGVPGAGAAALVVGLAGGYPIGAATAAALVRSGDISREEGERLLAFCNNSGPAFLVGAAGVGVFGSASIGLLLYASHALAALLTGALLRSGAPQHISPPPAPGEARGGALTEAVASSVSGMLSVCGYVVAFSALTGAMESAGVFSLLSGELAMHTPLGLHLSRALLAGFLELGSGLSALSGLPASPLALSAASLLASWGGLSVHMQTAAVVASAGLSLRRHTAGKLISSAMSAALTYAAARLLL